MSVLSYLEDLTKDLRLSTNEKEAIDTSISSLKTKLYNWFGDEISSILVFGSYKRNTNLCRKADNKSDVDILIVFKEFQYKPQTYINKLKTFMESKYSNSEIYQSNPCAILELHHIKFELTPALHLYDSTYKIPDKANSYTEWIYTEPFELDELARKQSHIQYKQISRLVKYWNCLNYKYFPSYKLEKIVLSSTLYCDTKNLKENLFKVLKSFQWDYSDPEYVRNYIDKTKKIIANVEYYEKEKMPYSAESEIKKIFKEL